MTVRKDSSRIEKTLDTSTLKTKQDIRVFLLLEWGKEVSQKKHRYFVEELSDGKRIYLDRPARINRGCDFIIYIEDMVVWKNGNDRPPSYKNLFADLTHKKSI